MRLHSVGLFFLGVAFKRTAEIFASLSTITTAALSLDSSGGSPLDQPTAHGNSSSNANDVGWREIHIFRGPSLETQLDKIGKAAGYSQSNQDGIVMDLLNQKKGGYFVDLAANHAVVLSNTFRLETNHDWNGLCIEPNPVYEWGHLHRRCTYVRAIVGANRMEKVNVVLPTDQNGPGGGIVDDKFDNTKEALVKKEDEEQKARKKKKGRRQKPSPKPVEMYTVSLTEILDRFQAPQIIDYLSLDVEGAEYYVMQSFAFDRYTIRVLTVERPNQELVDLLYRQGYVYLAALNDYGDEIVFVLKSELPALNLTVADTALYKSSTRLMNVPTDTFATKPSVLAVRRSETEMKMMQKATNVW